MSLKLTIENGIKDAMRAKDADRLRALRAIKSMILLEETSGSSADGLSADAEMKILMKAAKQRRDSLEVYVAQNRPDLAEKEQAELAIIKEFLPKQLSDTELTAKITEIIASVGATSPADMGKVMGAGLPATVTLFGSLGCHRCEIESADYLSAFSSLRRKMRSTSILRSSRIALICAACTSADTPSMANSLAI